jgi:hypothetical protein
MIINLLQQPSPPEQNQAFDFEWRSGYLIMTPKRRVLILP